MSRADTHDSVRESLVDFMVDCITDRYCKAKCKVLLNKANPAGNTKDEHFEQIYAEARGRLLSRATLERRDFVAEAIAQFELCIRDTQATWAEKLKATIALTELVGVGAKFSDTESAEDRAKEVMTLVEDMRKSVEG